MVALSARVQPYGFNDVNFINDYLAAVLGSYALALALHLVVSLGLGLEAGSGFGFGLERG